MKRVFLTFNFWWVVAASVAFAQAAGVPKIKFDKTIYDFGKTSQVAQVAGKFVVENVGDAPLKLEKPTTTCGCTVASVKPEMLQPGEKGELAFTLNVGPARASLQKYITVPSNDPQNPRANLTLKVEYLPIFDITPQMVYMDNLRAGAITNTTLSIKRNDGKPLAISKIQPTMPWITGRLEDVKPEEASAKVVLEIKPEGTPRRFSDPIKIIPEDPKEQPINFFVSGRIVGDIACTPEVLYWTISSNSLANLRPPSPQVQNPPLPEMLALRRMVVSSTSPGKSVQITNVSTSPNLQDVVKIELKPSQPGKIYELQARLTKVPPTTTSGTIFIDTDVVSQPKITVPVTVHVLPR